MIVYFDTSALLKLVIDEPGRDVVIALTEVATTASTSRVTYPECHAALAAAQRSRRLSWRGYANALTKVRLLDERLTILELDRDLAHHSGALSERHSLRGFDAVHLAAAATLRRRERPVIFATWDKRLHQAAFDTGLTPAPALL